MVESEVFLMKPKHQLIYPNKKSKFMVPNPEKKVDYSTNACLSQLTNEFEF